MDSERYPFQQAANFNSDENSKVMIVIEKIWAKALLVSASIGALGTMVAQYEKVSIFIESHGLKILDRVTGFALGQNSIKYHLARIVIQNHVGNDVCITSVVPIDYDGDGTNTDLLVKFGLEKEGFECSSIPSDIQVYSVKRKGWGYDSPVRIPSETANVLAYLDLYTTEAFLLGENPVSVLDRGEIYVFGYQKGTIQNIGEFSEYPFEGGRGFEMKRYDPLNSWVIKSTEGYHLIRWDEANEKYLIQWTSPLNKLGNEYHQLYFNRGIMSEGAADISIPLMYDGKTIDFGPSHSATILIDKLGRLSLDPACVAQTGMKEVDDELFGVFVLSNEQRHEIKCFYENGSSSYSINFIEKNTVFASGCSSDICPCENCSRPEK